MYGHATAADSPNAGQHTTQGPTVQRPPLSIYTRFSPSARLPPRDDPRDPPQENPSGASRRLAQMLGIRGGRREAQFYRSQSPPPPPHLRDSISREQSPQSPHSDTAFDERIVRAVLDRTAGCARLTHVISGVVPGDTLALRPSTPGLAPGSVRAYMPDVEGGGVLCVTASNPDDDGITIATLPAAAAAGPSPGGGGGGGLGVHIAEARNLCVEYDVPSAPWHTIHRVHLARDAASARLETSVVLKNAGSQSWEGVHVALASGGRMVRTLPAPLVLPAATTAAAVVESLDGVRARFETTVAACGAVARVLDLFHGEPDKWIDAPARMEVYDADGVRVLDVELDAGDMQPTRGPEGAFVRIVYERNADAWRVCRRVKEASPRPDVGARTRSVEYRFTRAKRARFDGDSVLVQHEFANGYPPRDIDVPVEVLGDGRAFLRVLPRDGEPVVIVEGAAADDGEPGQAGGLEPPSPQLVPRQQQQQQQQQEQDAADSDMAAVHAADSATAVVRAAESHKGTQEGAMDDGPLAEGTSEAYDAESFVDDIVADEDDMDNVAIPEDDHHDDMPADKDGDFDDWE